MPFQVANINYKPEDFVQWDRCKCVDLCGTQLNKRQRSLNECSEKQLHWKIPDSLELTNIKITDSLWLYSIWFGKWNVVKC